jgi:hypothetical protein
LIPGTEDFFEEEIALIVPPTSSYLHLFNNEIKVMLESGLVKKWKSQFWPQKDKCSATAYGGVVSNRTVSIGDMQGSFYLLLLGFFLALIVLVIEFILHKRQKQRVINTLKIFVTTNSTQFWQQKRYPFLN